LQSAIKIPFALRKSAKWCSASLQLGRKDGANQLRVSFDPFGLLICGPWRLLCVHSGESKIAQLFKLTVREDWYQDFLLRCENQPNQFDASFDEQIFMETEVGPGAMSTT